jgi:MSHA biogenesis protein MshI
MTNRGEILLMQWPFRRSQTRDQLVFAWHAGALAYVQGSQIKDGRFQVKRFGVERQDGASAEDFEKRLTSLKLNTQDAHAMLRPEQYQLLQIDTPAVPAEELRTAARWQIRDMVDTHMDDLTLEVIKVGDPRQRAGGHLFVVAASNAVIREVMRIGQALHSEVHVIDIQDMAQRNLQSAWSRNNASVDRAHASLVITDDNQALLTICAHEELFYTRRIDLGEGFMRSSLGDLSLAIDDDDIGGEELALLSDEAPNGLEENMLGGDENRLQRVVVEIQRSLDLWDRTWPNLVLDQLSVYAGVRTHEIAVGLGQELGQAVYPLDLQAQFPGFEDGRDADRQMCWPLLGVLMRNIN